MSQPAPAQNKQGQWVKAEKPSEVLAPASLVSLMCIYRKLALLFSLFKIKAPDIRSPGT